MCRAGLGGWTAFLKKRCLHMYDISTVSLRLLFLPASRTATAHTIRKMRGDWRQESAETEPSRTGRAERGASGRTARALVARGGDGSGEGEIGLPVAVGSWFAGQAPCQLPPPPHQLSHDRFPDPLPYLCETPPPGPLRKSETQEKGKQGGQKASHRQTRHARPTADGARKRNETALREPPVGLSAAAGGDIHVRKKEKTRGTRRGRV